MPPEQNDVKSTEAASSAATTDVNTKPTFESTANSLIEEALAKGSSPDAEESDVLKKNTTEEEKPAIESAKAETDKLVKKEQEETDKKETETKEKETEQTAEETDETKESATETAHEESIPYSRFKEVNDKAARFETLAKDHENLITFCQQNNIPPDQFKGNLEILALANTNPLEAIKRTEAFLEQLKVSAGTGLPGDLQKEVNEARAEFETGNISKERLAIIESRMKELAKARHQSTTVERQNHFAQLQQQQAQQQEFLGALSAWASTKVKLDPSFKPTKDATKPGKFEDFLMKNQELWTNKPPQNISEAVAYADQALDYVNKMIQRYQPPAKPKKAPLSSVHSRSTESDKPKSMDDVMKSVAKKHGYS